MAIDLFSESPRISFSHDLLNTDIVPVEAYPNRPDPPSLKGSNSEFDFCICDRLENQHSSADELFSDGRIRPIQLQQRFITSKHVSKSTPQSLTSLPPLPPNEASNQEILKQSNKSVCLAGSEQKHHSKSFWRIKRSSSLHCENTYKKSSFWSLPLLSRSNSTGSVPSSKQNSKETQKLSSQKQAKNSMGMYSSSSSSFYSYPLSQKPPLKKNYGGYYGNGVRINPVLNVPPPYISKGTANLFGLGSFFRNGKDKKNKK